jgi:hypothetical protein
VRLASSTEPQSRKRSCVAVLPRDGARAKTPGVPPQKWPSASAFHHAAGCIRPAPCPPRLSDCFSHLLATSRDVPEPESIGAGKPGPATEGAETDSTPLDPSPGPAHSSSSTMISASLREPPPTNGRRRAARSGSPGPGCSPDIELGPVRQREHPHRVARRQPRVKRRTSPAAATRAPGRHPRRDSKRKRSLARDLGLLVAPPAADRRIEAMARSSARSALPSARAANTRRSQVSNGLMPDQAASSLLRTR